MDKRLRELTGEPHDKPSGLPLSEAGARKATFAVEVLADMIHNNAVLTMADMRDFAAKLDTAVEVEIAGVRFSVEQLKSDPELRQNIAIGKEIMGGEYDRHDELTLLTPAVAAALAVFPGDELYLDDLTSLDLDTAVALAQFPGDLLSFLRLTALHPDTAAALAQFGGEHLYLDNLTSLDPDAAAALARFEGRIHCPAAIRAQIDQYKSPSS